MTNNDGLITRLAARAEALHGLMEQRRWARWMLNGLVVAAATVSIAGRAQTFQNPPAPAPMTMPPLIQPRTDVSTIVTANLFGIADNIAAQGMLARSSLNLVVTGLLATGQPGGMVVVSVDGQPETSFVTGDDLMPGVRLHAVETDRIIIARGGMLETVPLKEIESGGKASLLVASASDAMLAAAPSSPWAPSATYTQLAADSSAQGAASAPPVSPAPKSTSKPGRHGKGRNGGASGTPAASSVPAAGQTGPKVPTGGNAQVPGPKAGAPVATVPQPAPGTKVPEIPRPAPGKSVEGPPRPAQ